MKKTLDWWNRGFSIGGYRINNLTYTDDITLIATSMQDLGACQIGRDSKLKDRTQIKSPKDQGHDH